MLKRVHRHTGTAGLVVAVIALVFAMLGGAYAATQAGRHHLKKGFVVTQLNQIKPSVQKQLKGNQGPPGEKGSAGSKGDKGDPGSEGKAGNDGAAGKNATVAEIPAGPGVLECGERGGALVNVEDAAAEDGVEVCNGENGAVGSPWTAGGTLPPGAEEKGAWSYSISEAGVALGAISFPIPLNIEEGVPGAGVGATKVHYSTSADYANFCENIGSEDVKVKESAESITLCVRALETTPTPTLIQIKKPSIASRGMGPTGAEIFAEVPAAARGVGVWAVKG